jgi:hypothetical protein
MKRLVFILSIFLTVNCAVYAQLVAPGSQYKSSVSPLLTSLWGQGTPYNSLCPTRANSSGAQEHCPVGCVACALGQILNYHKYPEIGNGSKSYKFIVEASADFGNTHYDWANMRDTYVFNYTSDEVSAVATLLYHCGVAVGMMYALTGSSAFTYSNIPKCLETFFRYDPADMKYLSRSNYTKEEWMNLIFNELSNGRPIFYAGNSTTQGSHAWVLDGYNEKGEVHINWGWKGLDNDYYDIDLNNVSDDFNNMQSMVIGIKPLPSTSGIEQGVVDPQKDIMGVYDINGSKISSLKEGLNIIRYTDGSSKKVMVK